MPSVRPSAALALGAFVATLAACTAQRGTSEPTPQTVAAPASAALPIKLAPRPTTAAITPTDLMTRVYIFADDSMMGRQVGTEYNLKGTAYIEREVRRLGLVPAGTEGYYQNLPLFTYSVDTTSVLRVAGQTITRGADYLVYVQREARVALDGVPLIHGGTLGDSASWISADAAAGKIVVLTAPSTANPLQVFGGTSRFGRAAAIVIGSLDRLPPNVQRFLATPRTALTAANAPAPGPPAIFVTPRVAGLLFTSLTPTPGSAGQPLQGTLVLRRAQAPGRNVVAILPGSDPVLKNEYIAIGAHNDHIGFTNNPVDHDSIRAFNMVARVQGADSPRPASLTAEQQGRIRVVTDSLRARHGMRRDSINNGADDDGSGSMTVLEIAEALASAPVKPKRSILFVWHTGEEAGLWGAEHFTDNPTVPRESIVAQLNLDMVGRGGAGDVTGELKEGGLSRGGPGYVQLIGSRRLSTELGDIVEDVNRTNRLGLAFDYSQDANGHPQNIYCRSDHYEYARYGIPVVFFTTGGHSDYHQVTDEPQYLDYGRMTQVATLVHDTAVRLANLDHRVLVDKPKPDPRGRCVQ